MELHHVWDWFKQEFLPFYGSNGFGVESISYAEIESWARLTGRKPEPDEVVLLKRLDEKFRSVMAKKKPTKGRKSEPDIDASDAGAVKDLTSGLGRKRTIVRKRPQATTTQ